MLSSLCLTLWIDYFPLLYFYVLQLDDEGDDDDDDDDSEDKDGESDTDVCTVCGVGASNTDDSSTWVGCDGCPLWYHHTCLDE